MDRILKNRFVLPAFGANVLLVLVAVLAVNPSGASLIAILAVGVGGWLIAVFGISVGSLTKNDVDALVASVRGAAEGRPPSRLSVPELVPCYEALQDLADDINRQHRCREEISRSSSDFESRALGAEAEVQEAAESLRRLRDELHTASSALGRMEDKAEIEGKNASRLREEVSECEAAISEHVEELSSGVQEQVRAVDQTTQSMMQIAAALQQIAQHVEALASSAEESSSSILQMTATNDEVAENMANLAASVRETVSSIEEMAYSIKEVARNVDALSLTAEETSSSMNEMDVSIDQVQSNANETARLSEEVALDADRGAEAILKTIEEINRIRETSGEAVDVISNLGTRIEAIGDILNVIDDVAEQTNLLALNAAIIAAQAGEHGKGFAVVADEIKDLAERAGASTKEIAELIKTIQSESKNAITAVERGAQTVDRGVQVSADAEEALKKILESSQKSTGMVRAIARATVEQAKGSKQVTDAIGRIAETVQQIAAATAEQARGSELIMKGAEKMRMITQHVERSSQEQARGGRQISQSIENISNMVNHLHQSHRQQANSSEQTLVAARRMQELTSEQERRLAAVGGAASRLRKVGQG
ncbi:MAG: methyl-accepting chemotaxis protein [Myxococcota bacterium]